MSTGASAPRVNDLYDAQYYAHHCGEAYERTAAWTSFFGTVADHIIAELNPATVLDAGCALGFLVEALRDRGVDAHGIDTSEYAVEHARPDMHDFVRLGSVLEPLGRRYDLITCIEVLEHLAPAEAGRAVANLCAHTDHVLFTSTPHDYSEATHLNVRPPEHWAALFAQQGFVHDLDYDASYVVPWAVHFQRSQLPTHRIIAEYERALWRARHELDERNKVVLAQMRQVEASRVDCRELEALRLQHERDGEELRTLQLSLADRDTRVSLLSDQAEEAQTRAAELDGFFAAAPGRLMLKVSHRAARGLRRAAPPASRRRTLLRLARRAGEVLASEGPSALIARANQRRVRMPGRPWPPVQPSPDDAQYAAWLSRHDPTAAQLGEMLVENSRWDRRPLISIIVPVFDPPETWLDSMVSSVMAQVYTRWELCIADDCSPSPHVRSALERWAGLDERIRVTYRDRNGNIAAASNTALAMARGDYVALLDHDDILRPHALHRMVAALQGDAPADVLYSDEDKVLLDGTRGHVHFKGEFDPDYLLSTNYICHLSLFARSLLEDIGGFRGGLDGSQDHDLALRATAVARRVVHVPDVLYSWQQVPGSAALDVTAKPAAWEAGRKASEDALRSRGSEGTVNLGPHAGLLVARYPVPPGYSACVVLRVESRQQLDRALPRLREGSRGRKVHYVVATHDQTLSTQRDDDLTIVVADRPANQPALLNRAVRGRDEDAIVFIGPNLQPSLPGDWLTPLLEQVARPEIGAAGGRIVGWDGHPLEEGLRVGGPRIAESVGVRWPVIQRVGALSSSCLAVRRTVLEEEGGFDERFKISLYDVDLCLRLRRRDLGIIYTPLTEMRRLLVANDLGPGRDDAALSKILWADMPHIDPYVSPWLDHVQPLVIRAD